jgi:hypothetical protein
VKTPDSDVDNYVIIRKLLESLFKMYKYLYSGGELKIMQLIILSPDDRWNTRKMGKENSEFLNITHNEYE